MGDDKYRICSYCEEPAIFYQEEFQNFFCLDYESEHQSKGFQESLVKLNTKDYLNLRLLKLNRFLRFTENHLASDDHIFPESFGDEISGYKKWISDRDQNFKDFDVIANASQIHEAVKEVEQKLDEFTQTKCYRQCSSEFVDKYQMEVERVIPALMYLLFYHPLWIVLALLAINWLMALHPIRKTPLCWEGIKSSIFNKI